MSDMSLSALLEPPVAGPEERKLRNRWIFKLTGRWPNSVVRERLADFERRHVALHRRLSLR